MRAHASHCVMRTVTSVGTTRSRHCSVRPCAVTSTSRTVSNEVVPSISGEVGRDSGRAEFELLDRDVLQVGAARDVGRRRAVRRIDLGRAHLLLHAEIAFDGLRGRDAPPVLLIERQRRVERRAQVERAGEGYRRLPAFGERHRGDVHVADVGGLQKRQDDGLLRSVDLGCAVEPFGLDRLDVDRHHGVGQVVMDAAGEERRKAQCAEKDESFHGYSFFLFHK